MRIIYFIILFMEIIKKLEKYFKYMKKKKLKILMKKKKNYQRNK